MKQKIKKTAPIWTPFSYILTRLKTSRAIFLIQLITLALCLSAFLILHYSTTVSGVIKELAISTPQFTRSIYSYITLAGLAALATVLYYYIDYEQHYKPLVHEMANVIYSPFHHAKVVVIPRMAYRWKTIFLWSGYATTSLIALATIISFQVAPAFAYAPDEFVTTWKTDNPGVSASNQITIPTSSFNGEVYDYDVDWGDASTSTDQTGDSTHEYGSAGIYTVKITGQFPRIAFNDGGDKNKILSVEQWGSNAWMSMSTAFRGASNLVINAVDVPDLTSTTSLAEMFKFAPNIDNGTANWNWNTSYIVNMGAMFNGATSFNQDIVRLPIY